MTMLSLIYIGPELYVAVITTVLYDSYDALQYTLDHLRRIKLNSYTWGNVADLCAEILVDSERLDSSVAFKPGCLIYITCVFEDNSDSVLRLWAIQKYKENMEFIKKLFV